MKVDQIWSDDIEVTEVTSGENIKTKVSHLHMPAKSGVMPRKALVVLVRKSQPPPLCGTTLERVIFQVKGIEESDVTPGFVLCCPANPIKTGKVFDAQVS